MASPLQRRLHLFFLPVAGLLLWSAPTAWRNQPLAALIWLLLIGLLLGLAWRLGLACRCMEAEQKARSHRIRDLETQLASRSAALQNEVSKRRMVERRLSESAERYRGIVEATQDAFWLLDDTGKILEVNDACCRLTGFSRQELLKRSLSDLDQATPERLAQLKERVMQFGSDRIETRYRNRAGHQIDVEIGITWLPESRQFVGFLHDISERREAEEKLRQAARVFENTDEGVMITDSEARIEMVNAAFSRITGYLPDEVLGQTADILQSGRHPAEFFEDMWRQLRHGGHWQGEVWNRRRNGQLYATWLTISDVQDDGGHIQHFVAVLSDITSLKQSQQRLDYLAHHDFLTGLPNRLLLKARIEHGIQRAYRERSVLALLFIDLDHFKEVNDRLGHAAGDELLQDVARRMAGLVRAEDTLARVGGDEFVLLLEGCPDRLETAKVADKLLALFPVRVDAEPAPILVTASIGVAFCPGDGTDADSLLDRADAAMYIAKSDGRARVHFPG